MSRNPNAPKGKDKKRGKDGYKMGPQRGDQKFELPDKLKPKRGGGDSWRQWSRPELAQRQTKLANQDFYAKAYQSDEQGRKAMHQLLTTLHTANEAMEDIRQPLDNPYLEQDAKTLEREVEKYRHLAARLGKQREGRLAMSAGEEQASKPSIRIVLRLLSGERLEASPGMVPRDYEELQRAFLEAFPWHVGVVCCEHPDGRAVHPQKAACGEGDLVCFREMSPPQDDLMTDQLQTLPAGWLKETYRPELLGLTSNLIAGGPREKTDTEYSPWGSFNSIGEGHSVIHNPRSRS